TRPVGQRGNALLSHRLAQADGGGIGRAHQRPAKGERATVLSAEIFRAPDSSDILDLDWGIIQDGGRAVARCERGSVYEGLEGRPRLAPGVQGSVEAVAHRAPRANQGPDLAGARVQGHHRPFDFSAGTGARSLALDGGSL